MTHSADLNLLLVEDDEIDVQAMQRALRARGFQGKLHVANDPDRALDLLGDVATRIDLVLLDLHMPPRSGHELLHDLRERSHAPVIVLTSSTDPDDLRRCFRAGAAGYFIKPPDGRALQRTLDLILGYWRRSERPPLA